MKLPNLERVLGFPLENFYRAQVESNLAHYALHTGKIIGVLILFSQIIMLTLMLNRPGGIFASLRRQWYCAFYLILIAVTLLYLLFLLIMRRRIASSSAMILRFSAIYGVILCLWSCGITLNDQFGGNGLNVYIYIILTVAAFTTLKPWQSLTLFSVYFILLNLLLPYFPTGTENRFNNMSNTLFITVLAVGLSITMYRNRVFNYYDRMVIQQQCHEIQIMNDQLQKLVMIDELTQMHNRRYLEEVVTSMLQKQGSTHSVAGMMVDIDHFKQYNDAYGHQQGDFCLRQIAEIILTCTDESDISVVRYGGEEFFLCLFGKGEAQTAQIAEQIRWAVENRRLVRDDLPIGYVTISVGYCWRPSPVSNPIGDFVHWADEALYMAKANGRNCVANHGSLLSHQ